MRTLVFSLLDRKTREFGQLILAHNEESMERLIIDTCKGTGNMIDKYPEDFDLFKVGEFESETGFLESGTPQLVGNVAVTFDKLNRKD